MYRGTLIQETSIKQEPPCEEHDVAALRVRESQIKPEPSECSDMQLTQERAGQAGTSASLQDMYLIYEGHVVKGEELVVGPEVWQRPLSLYKDRTMLMLEKRSDESGQDLTSISSTLHTRTHNQSPTSVPNSTKYICDICDEGFSNMHRLKSHMKTHRPSALKNEVQNSDAKVKSLTCHVCDKNFQQTGHLTRHLRIHTGWKPYDCHICKKTFTQKQNVERHMTIHTGEKPFSCAICTFKCTQKCDLENHLRVHSGEKPYKCEFCDLQCTRRTNLLHHLREVHKGERTFRCDVCLEKFSRKLTLTRHKRGHSGEKPFACASCNKRFTRKCTLVNHRCDTYVPKTKQPRAVYSTKFKQAMQRR